MIIGICSYGGTGSSAVTDLLKEYDELQVLDQAEFQYAFQPDGLQDLEYHLVKQHSRHMSGDVALHRYLDSTISWAKTPFVHKTIGKKMFIRLTKQYVSQLIQAEWIGIDNSDYMKKSIVKNSIVLGFKKIVFSVYERLTKKSWDIWPARKIFLSINPDNFYQITRKYTSNLLKTAGVNFNKPVVLDQPFEGDAPEQSFPFFDNPKAIVVDRDPRDLWLIGKYVKSWKSEWRFMPRRDIKTFVKYYRNLRKGREKKNTEKILYINFEDLVYNYEPTVKEIEKFLNLKQHSNKYKFFNPEISINNTQLMNMYPQESKDIKYIERELSEYLFDFSSYRKVSHSNNIF